ncbi:MAG TPA: alpha/beta hydrolase [Firmicutes bacterium]|nr:alpha/beta hydrolase [Bacillota bacterium]
MVNTLDNKAKIPMEKPPPDLADVAYGSHERHVIDFWHPHKPGHDPAPLVVYIHGGGFKSGDKTKLPAHLLRLCLEAGFAVAAINYRLSNEVTFPAFMHDAGRAIQFMRSKAAEWHINAERIAATGGSAGGGISLWLAFHPDLADPTSPDPVARQSTSLTCVGAVNTQCSYDPLFYQEIGLAPATVHSFMLPFYGLSVDQMDTPEARRLFKEAAPMTWFHACGPPVFLYYNWSDEPLPAEANLVMGAITGHTEINMDPQLKKTLLSWAIHHPKMGKIIKEKLTALGVECELHIVTPEQTAEMQVKMVEFFKRHMMK